MQIVQTVLPHNVSSAGNDDAMILYEWLADCATTSHVTNMRDAFTTYTPLRKPVHGVGNAQTHAEGRGTVKIKSTSMENNIISS